MNIHEEAFVKAFIQSDRQERFLSFLRDPTKRAKFVREFDHWKTRFLDVRYRTLLTGSSSLPPRIYSTLRPLGAPETCWVMGGRFDAQERELLDALTNSGDGFALSCIPGKLAYLESENEKCCCGVR
jgi:hypothetical protein